MVIFDYIFYRFFEFYSRKEKTRTPLFTSSGYLSFIQFLFIYFVLMSFEILSESNFNLIDYLSEDKEISKILLLIFVSLEIYNYIRYRKKSMQDKLHRRFRMNVLNQKIKIWMFILLGVLLFSLPILLDLLLR